MRLPIAVIAAVLLPCGTAQAGWRIDRAQQIAAIVWHNPCASQGIKVEWPRALESGWADEPVPREAGGVAGTVNETDCIVYLNPHHPFPWPVLCTVILHETGHLAGFNDPTNGSDPAHSSNPRSVMYESRERTDPRCAHRGRPFLERRGLLG